MSVSHPHPCNFSLRRSLDRGWGEIAFEYHWDSASGEKDPLSRGNPDLAHCHLYEFTRYSGDLGQHVDGWFHPADPPFLGWKFRDPTDGRSGPVGMECFPASQGWAWDRHKIGGPIAVPENGTEVYLIVATQTYRFFCDLCGVDQVVSGPHAGPHEIARSYRRKEETGVSDRGVWRYAITKHGHSAWMDLAQHGFVGDSLGLDYGPYWPGK